MVKVTLRQEELEELKHNRENPNLYLDSLLRRFKKACSDSKVIEECRKREYFLKKSLKRKEKSKRARIARILANKGRKRNPEQ